MAEPVAIVRNVGTEDWVDAFNNDTIIIRVGDTHSFPERVAKHFLGDWDAPTEEDRKKELKRVTQRRPEGDPAKLELEKMVVSEGEKYDSKKKEPMPETILSQEVKPEFPDLKKKAKAKK